MKWNKGQFPISKWTWRKHRVRLAMEKGVQGKTEKVGREICLKKEQKMTPFEWKLDFDVDEQPYGGQVFPTMMGWTPSWIRSCHHREAGISNSGMFLVYLWIFWPKSQWHLSNSVFWRHLILSIPSRKQDASGIHTQPSLCEQRVFHACVLLFNGLSAGRKTDPTGKSTAGTQHNKWLIFTQQSSLNAATCQTLWSHF